MQTQIEIETLKPLRKCVHCGLEAYSEGGLKHFQKDAASKYGRKNVCHNCTKQKVPCEFKSWRQRAFGIVDPEVLEAWSKP
jgi:superfamily II helicase